MPLPPPPCLECPIKDVRLEIELCEKSDLLKLVERYARLRTHSFASEQACLLTRALAQAQQDRRGAGREDRAAAGEPPLEDLVSRDHPTFGLSEGFGWFGLVCVGLVWFGRFGWFALYMAMAVNEAASIYPLLASSLLHRCCRCRCRCTCPYNHGLVQQVLVKKKADEHAHRCRAFCGYSCLSCSKSFHNARDWGAHFSCISEAEKYHGQFAKTKKGPPQQPAAKPAVPAPVAAPAPAAVADAAAPSKKRALEASAAAAAAPAPKKPATAAAVAAGDSLLSDAEFADCVHAVLHEYQDETLSRRKLRKRVVADLTALLEQRLPDFVEAQVRGWRSRLLACSLVGIADRPWRSCSMCPSCK